MSELELYKGMVKKMKDKTIQDILDKLNEGYDDLEVWEFSYLDNYITNLQQELQRKDNIIKDAKEVLLTTNNIEKALNVLDKINELEGDNK